MVGFFDQGYNMLDPKRQQLVFSSLCVAVHSHFAHIITHLLERAVMLTASLKRNAPAVESQE